MTNNANAVNNLLSPQNQSFCELITHCEIKELACRVVSAVGLFFSYLIIGIYESLAFVCNAIDYVITCQCCDEGDPASAPPVGGPVGGAPRVDVSGRAAIPPRPRPISRQRNEDQFDEFLSQLQNSGFLTPPNAGNGIVWDALEEDALVIPSAQVAEEAPTAQVAKDRREAALALLSFRKAEPSKFVCAAEILEFNLDEATQKYKTDQHPKKLLQWYDYAALDPSERADLEGILTGFTRDNGSEEKSTVVRHLVSKLHYILTEKEARIRKLTKEKGEDAQKALKQEIEHIFSKLKDANSNCIDQTLSQAEDLIIEVLASENPLGKNSTLSLLHYKAAHVLFRYRANLIKEILIKDPALSNPALAAHMADIEREVKKRIATAMGMQGAILDAGAAFGGLVEQQAKDAAMRAAALFLDQYKPAEYLREQCQVIWGATKAFRSDLIQWATTYYDLEGEDDTLAKAVVKSHEELESLVSVVAVELNPAGTQLFLEAAGIIQTT